MAHLIPKLRSQFAEFLNDCQLKRLRILYLLTGSQFLGTVIRIHLLSIINSKIRSKYTVKLAYSLLFLKLINQTYSFYPIINIIYFSRTLVTNCKSQGCLYMMLITHRLIHQVNKLRGRNLNIHKFQARAFIISLFRYSCQHYLLRCKILLLKKTNLLAYSMFCYPINTIFIFIIIKYQYLKTRCRYIVQIRYIFGAFNLYYINQCSVTRSLKNGRF